MPNDMKAARNAFKQSRKARDKTIDIGPFYFNMNNDFIELEFEHEDESSTIAILDIEKAMRLRNFLTNWANDKRTRERRKSSNDDNTTNKR